MAKQRQVIKTREIKFRAWDEKLKFMYHADSVSLNIDGEICYLDTDGEWGYDLENRIKLMQYTGLKDENGKEIYESDIVAFIDSTSTEGGYFEQNCIGMVQWSEDTASFDVANRLSAESYEILDGGCAVIGNFYENPELI